MGILNKFKNLKTSNMKKILFAVVAMLLSIASFAEPSKSLKNQFKQAYPNAKDAVWSESANGYAVYFRESAETAVRVFYDKDENARLTIRYYPADNLPALLKKKMQSQHPNKELMTVTECSNENGTNYYVLMQDAKKLYRVQYLSNGDEYVVTEKINKQRP
jgi:hypothetical protein